MTPKQKIIEVIERLPDEVSIDEAIERLYLLSKIERGIKQADAGQVISHEQLLRELEGDHTAP